MDFSRKIESIEKEIGRLSPVQKILLGTDGSVTRLLEIITGSAVTIQTRIQKIIPADAPVAEDLAIREGDPVNYRVVEIKNKDSPEVLIYAVSHTPIERLSPGIRLDLMQADIPIGRILTEHRMETRREITDAYTALADEDSRAVFQIFEKETLLNRKYRIIHDEKPLISIRETFPYTRFCDEKRLLIEAPSRLHLGLIDMHGGLGRVDGGIGITLQNPKTLLEIKPHASLQVHGTDPDSVSVVRDVAGRLFSHLGIRTGADITIRSSYDRHVGLGSGTSLALSTAYAVCQLYNKSMTIRDLSRMVGRGGTSGIGTGAFEKGGFIIDGGHSFGGSGEKSVYSPSSASSGVQPGPVTVRHEFPPDWKICIAIPFIPPGAHGPGEQDIFTRFCPVPIHEVREICHEVLMRMLPAVADHDIEQFGRAVNSIQNLGFKKVELSLQPEYYPGLLEEMRLSGAVGAGMSSFGPALYAISDTGMEDIMQASRRYLDQYDGGEVFLTRARNEGAVIRNT
ncbi:MAG: DUF98 domain-containing protein [Methanospirillaceae archaeon]|nr:DUF98 domain-containing protein [Methanospirillaceae archaeon]